MTESAISSRIIGTRALSGTAFLRDSRIWISLLLWIGSNVFVATTATVATWEGLASYHRMVDFCRWDCGWYATVLDGGYSTGPTRVTGEANWPFHPLFPATAYPLHKWLGLSFGSSIVLASKLELLVAIYAFLLFLSDEVKTPTDRARAASLVAFNPYLIYAHAGYAEPLYFALIAFAFYFAGRRRWIVAGAMGGLASATRFVGFLFSASYATLWLEEGAIRSGWRRLDLNRIIGLLLCPLGTALFTLYMYHHIGDALVQEHVQVAWGKIPGNPIHTLRQCLMQHHWPRVWAIMAIVSLLMSAWLFRLRKADMGIFLALSVLIPVSATCWVIPRYIWWQPPFLYGIYRILGRNEIGWLSYLAFASGMAGFMVLSWFSGHNFVM